MSSNIPTVRQIAWISIVPQLLIMGLIMLIWYQFNTSVFLICGAISYIFLSQLLKRTFTREHRKGMFSIKSEKFEEAVSHFQKSYDFFRENEWMDKFRFVALLSSSKMTYKEMALNNIAFCYGQLGNGTLSKEYYERTLQEFPNSGMAKAALRFLHSVKKAN